MKRKILPVTALIFFLLEIISLLLFYNNTKGYEMDSVEINRIQYYVEKNPQAPSKEFKYDYAIVYLDGTYYETTPMAHTVTDAVLEGDIILDILDGDTLKGHILIHNGLEELYHRNMKITCIMASVYALLDLILAISYTIYLKKNVIKPFDKLDFFARQIASGNLEVPLEMDQENIFGAFTEAFDILREELAIAKEKERLANESKKELVAKLSHDIKTPVASIMATTELAMAKNPNDKASEMIYQKAAQINSLVVNLFESSLEEISQLSVKPMEMQSKELYAVITASDYNQKIKGLEIPECIVEMDSLRICQVFDNLISNSYKYANTPIDVKSYISDGYLVIELEDYGSGVEESFLPLALEKYQRGGNSKGKTGAGLGLYLSSDFMNRMGGNLSVRNGSHGFLAIVSIKLV